MGGSFFDAGAQGRRGRKGMTTYNPPHPGEFIREVYLEELAVSARTVVEKLMVSPSTFTRLLNGKSGVTPEMALRLSKVLGRSAESWLMMQNDYDLWHMRQTLDLEGMRPLLVRF